MEERNASVQTVLARIGAVCSVDFHSVGNLPGWRWARIKQLALVGLSSSWHSEACNALGALSESPTAKFVSATISVRAAVNLYLSIEI